MWCSMSSARPLVRCQCPDANPRRTARETVARWSPSVVRRCRYAMSVLGILRPNASAPPCPLLAKADIRPAWAVQERRIVLAEAGCSDHEIAAITGHRDLAMVQLYTRAVRNYRLPKTAFEKRRLAAAPAMVARYSLASPRRCVLAS